MNMFNIFNKKEVLTNEEKEQLEFIEKDSYMREACRLVRERGIKKAREDFK